MKTAFECVEQRWIAQQNGLLNPEDDSFFNIMIKNILAKEVSNLFPSPVVQPVPGVQIVRDELGESYRIAYMASDESDIEGPTALFLMKIDKEGIEILPK